MKNVGFIGRGGVGTLFASIVQKKIGNEHLFFIVGEDRYESYIHTPFYCNDTLCTFSYIKEPSQHSPLDLLIISVKYPVLQDTLALIKPFVGEDTIVLCLLNGIVSEDICEQYLGKGIVIHSIAQKMDVVKEGNHVRFSACGEIVMGTPYKERAQALLKVADFFTEVGLPHRVSNVIVHEQWNKLMLNCAINQVCALYDVPYGACQCEGPLRTLLIDVMNEVSVVAQKEGFFLGCKEIDEWMKAIDALSANSMPSMRQDMLAKRKSEIGLFSKTIIELGCKHQIEVPLNTMFYNKIKEKESAFDTLSQKL